MSLDGRPWEAAPVIEVRRDGDGELCGHVRQQGERWLACTVFGTPLGDHADAEAARGQVLAEGLASLTERWLLVDGATGEEEVVCLQHVAPSGVVVALGYHSMPGVPTRSVTAGELAAGRWSLRRS